MKNVGQMGIRNTLRTALVTILCFIMLVPVLPVTDTGSALVSTEKVYAEVVPEQESSGAENAVRKEKVGTSPDSIRTTENEEIIAAGGALAEPVEMEDLPGEDVLTGYFSVNITDWTGTPIEIFGEPNEATFALLISPEEPGYDHYYAEDMKRFGFFCRDEGLTSGTYLSPAIPSGDYWIRVTSSPAGLLLPDDNERLIPITITAANTEENPVSVTVAFLKDPHSDSYQNGKSGDVSTAGIQPLGLGGITGGASGTPIGYLADNTPVWQHAIYPAGTPDQSPGVPNAYCCEHGKYNPDGTPYAYAGPAPEGKFLSALVYLGGSDYITIQGAYWRKLGQWNGSDPKVNALYAKAEAALADAGKPVQTGKAENPPKFYLEEGQTWKNEAEVFPNGVRTIGGKQYIQYGPFTIDGASRGIWATGVPSGWLFGNGNGSTIYDTKEGTGTNKKSGKIGNRDGIFYIYVPVGIKANGSKMKVYGGYEGAETTTTAFSDGWAYDASSQDLAVGAGEPDKVKNTDPLGISRSLVFRTYFSVSMQKEDSTAGASPQGAATLQGAVYGLYEAGTGKLAAIANNPATTDVNGRIAFTDIVWGQYYIQEITPSNGYMLNPGLIEIDPDTMADSDLKIMVTGNEIVKRYNIHVRKEDFVTDSSPQGDAKLLGAVYSLYRTRDNSLVGTAMVSAAGIASFTELVYDYYYVQETTPPEGYLLNPDKIYIDPDTMGTTIVTPGYSMSSTGHAITVTGTDTVMKQAIEFRKFGFEADSDIIPPLQDVGFSVYLISELSKVRNGEIVKPAEGWDKAQFANYFQGDYTTETRAKTDGIVTPEYFSSANGLVRTDELPYGDYLVVETTMSRHHAPISPFIVSITKDATDDPLRTPDEPRPPSRPAGLYGGFVDMPFRLGIIKIDAETGRSIFKNAAYKIWSVDDQKWVTQKVSYPIAGIYGTDTNPYRLNPETGSLILPNPIAGGVYTIVEVEAPSGYVLTGYEGLDTGGYYDYDGGDGELYTPEDSAYTPNPKTDITIVMDSELAAWNDELETFVVNAIVSNEPQRGHINIHKEKELPPDEYPDSRQTAAMPGVTFKLFAKEDIMTQDGHGIVLYAAGSEISLHSKSAGVYTAVPSGSENVVDIVTDADGNAVVKLLPVGRYTLREVSVSQEDMHRTPDGTRYSAYKVDYEQDLEITGNTDTNRFDANSVWHQENPFVYINVNPLNLWMLGHISLHKMGDCPEAPYIDDNGNIQFPYKEEPLDGIVFEIIAKEDLVDVNTGEILWHEDDVVQTVTTDESGDAHARDLIPGEYTLHEKEPPHGYLPVSDEVFTITERNDHLDKFSFMTWNLTDVRQKLSVVIVKKDGVDGQTLAGAEFGIFAAEDIPLLGLTQEADSDNNTLVDKIKAFFTRFLGREQLPDPLKIQEGALVRKAVSGQDGKVSFTDLPPGKYIVREISPPVGYAKDTEFVHEIDLSYVDRQTEYLTWTGVCVNTPLDITAEVDKDTIRRTAAAFRSLPGQAGHDNIGDAEERYRYDVDFRSTAGVWADEFVVDDPLENADRKKIVVEELWTPVVWGDYDGLWNLWYATNKTNPDSLYSAVSAMATNPVNPDNPGNTAAYPNTGLKLLEQGLRTDRRYHFRAADFGLRQGEYLTHLRFEYGRVEVGFTSKNYEDESLNGEHRTISGEDLDLPSKEAHELILIDSAAFSGGTADSRQDVPETSESTDGVPGIGAQNEVILQIDGAEPDVDPPGQYDTYVTGIDGDFVDWTPIKGTRFYADGALHPGYELEPASYLVSAARPMTDVDIVSSVSARIARNVTLRAYDQDAVVTREIGTFEYKGSVYGVGPAKTLDEYPLFAWLIAFLSASIGLLILGRIRLDRRYGKHRKQVS